MDVLHNPTNLLLPFLKFRGPLGLGVEVRVESSHDRVWLYEVGYFMGWEESSLGQKDLP